MSWLPVVSDAEISSIKVTVKSASMLGKHSMANDALIVDKEVTLHKKEQTVAIQKLQLGKKTRII